MPTSAISSVSLTPRPSSCELGDEARDGRRVEQPGRGEPRRAEQLVHVVGRVGADEDVADRRPVRPLRQRVDRGREPPRRCAPQDVLLLEPAQPQPVG